MSKDTKKTLLDVAEYAARSRGWDGFSYADLAKAVGIRKASIHYYFPAKSDLSIALIERYVAEMRQSCGQIDAAHGTGGERLTAVIDHYRQALDQGKALCLCVSFSATRDSLPDEVLLRIASFRRSMVDWLASVFSRAQEDRSILRVEDSAVEASAALALLEGAHLAARAERDIARFDCAVKFLEQRCRPPRQDAA